MWYRMSKKSIFLLTWCFISLIVIFGPWGWNPTAGTYSWIVVTEGVFMILTPLIAVFFSFGKKSKKKADFDWD